MSSNSDICFCYSQMTTVNHGKYYAMKRVSKKQIVAKRQEEHMMFEKKILKAIQCDFIVRYPPSKTLTSNLLITAYGSLIHTRPENLFLSHCF